MIILAEHAPIVPQLLTIRQVATYVGLSHHTIYRFVSKRKIPHVKFGKVLRFNRTLIDLWIASQAVKVHRSVHG